jgi:CxxC motif-containing protein (DUF1111 family)
MSLQIRASIYFSAVLLVLFFFHSASAQQRLSLEAGLDYETGRAIFEKNWISAPASTTASDGLGPLYNARSCAQCHENGGRGQVKNSLVVRINDESYGQQIQTYSISGLPAEARVDIHSVQVPTVLPDGETVMLQKPVYSLSELEFGKLELLSYSPRIASSLAGLGLIEMIPQQQINILADEQDKNHDAISGRINWVWDVVQQTQVPGRFGWKAGQASLAQQSARALSLDIGIGSSLYPNPYGDCTVKQSVCLERQNGNSPGHDNLEASAVMLDTLLTYIRNIPVPANTRVEQTGLGNGKILFSEASCDTCHHPQFEVSGQQIEPYSDFLLHDMGIALSDSLSEGNASVNEWRTAPLWGIGRIQQKPAYMHDGRARNLQEAILWHGGEAQSAVNRYKSMAKQDRDDLIRFLNSL